MSSAQPRALVFGAWTAWAVAVVAFAVEVPLLYVNAAFAAEDVAPVVLAVEDLAFVAVATLSLLILRTQPANRVGWAMMLVGAGFPLEGFFFELAAYSLRTWGEIGLTSFTAWVSRWIWIASQLGFPFVLLYYPDSRLTSPRWRWAVRYIWAAATIAFIWSAFNVEPMEELGDLANPIGVDMPGIFDPLFAVVFSSYFLLPLLGAVSLIPRYRRSVGVERQQMKLIAWVAIFGLLFFFVVTSDLVFVSSDAVDSLANTVFTLFVGTAITAGIVKYRVFEIDRIISRSISYAVVVATIGLGYFGLVTVVTRFLPTQDALVVAVSTLAAAAVFNPLRRRIQAAADRKFNRSGYEADLVAQGFATELERARGVDEIGQTWEETVVRALEPSTSGLWLNEEAMGTTRGS